MSTNFKFPFQCTGLADIKSEEPSLPSLLLLIISVQLIDSTAKPKWLEIVATDGEKKARLVAFGKNALFFSTKIKGNRTYRFVGVSVKNTPEGFCKAGMIPFDLTLGPGIIVTPELANIQPPLPKYTKFDHLQSMVDAKVNLIAVIIDYEEATTNVTSRRGSVLEKRELTLADDTGFKLQATLWGETARSFEPIVAKAVIITARIQSYQKYVTASVHKIMYANNDPAGTDLEIWYERQGNKPIEQLAVSLKRLSTANYPLVDCSLLPSIADGTRVKLKEEILAVSVSGYDICYACRRRVVQMGQENFCQKCDKTNVHTSKKFVFKLSLSKFQLKLYQDCAANLLNFKEFVQHTHSEQQELLRSLQCTTYTILVEKRRTRLNTVEYVALDFHKANDCKRPRNT